MGRILSALLLAFLLHFGISTCALGASLWPPDSTLDLAICGMPSFIQRPLAVSDGAHGLIALWIDYRTGISNSDLYARRVDANGDTLWQPNGTAVCTGGGNIYLPSMIDDGNGGAFIGWTDDGQGGIYAQHLDANGAAKWRANGTSVSTSYTTSFGPLLVGDGVGGTYVIWAPGSGSVLAQHLDSLGVKWTLFAPQQGITLRNIDGPVVRGIVSDSAGGAIVAMGSSSGSNNIVTLQRIDAAKTVHWGVNGVDVCANPSAVINSLVPDAAGGAIVAWEDRRNGTSNPDIFVQRVSAAGVPLWTANGVAVCTAPHFQTLPLLRALGDGGVLVVWRDERTNVAGDFYAQRLDASGNPQWAANGVPVASGILQAQAFSIAAGDLDSTFVVWNSTAGGGGDVFAQQLDGLGNRLFGPAGVALCRGGGSQTQSVSVADGRGGVYAVFDDARSGDDDVYGQHLNADGSAGGSPVAVPPTARAATLALKCWPSPWRTELRIALVGPVDAPGRAEVFDLAGRRVWDAPIARGANALLWDGRDARGRPVGPGVYRVRVTRAAARGIATVVRLR